MVARDRRTREKEKNLVSLCEVCTKILALKFYKHNNRWRHINFICVRSVQFEIQKRKCEPKMFKFRVFLFKKNLYFGFEFPEMFNITLLLSKKLEC